MNIDIQPLSTPEVGADLFQICERIQQNLGAIHDGAPKNIHSLVLTPIVTSNKVHSIDAGSWYSASDKELGSSFHVDYQAYISAEQSVKYGLIGTALRKALSNIPLRQLSSEIASIVDAKLYEVIVELSGLSAEELEKLAVGQTDTVSTIAFIARIYIQWPFPADRRLLRAADRKFFKRGALDSKILLLALIQVGLGNFTLDGYDVAADRITFCVDTGAIEQVVAAVHAAVCDELLPEGAIVAQSMPDGWQIELGDAGAFRI
jgi:hypothetical protein